MTNLRDRENSFYGSGVLSVLIFFFFIFIISMMLDNNRDSSKKKEEPIEKTVNKNKNTKKEETNTYIVKEEDTLSKISILTGISVREIKKINRLSSNNLVEGQPLVLKEDKETPIKIVNNIPNQSQYTVKGGDSLYNIAINNKTSLEKLKRVNRLKSDNLKIGQILILPN